MSQPTVRPDARLDVRLDDLERMLSRLAIGVNEARLELGALRTDLRPPVVPPQAAPVAPAPPPLVERPPVQVTVRAVPEQSASFAPLLAGRIKASAEDFFGRYGALVLGGLLIVMGAGALVSWALRNGLLGPWIRVGIGGAIAITLASLGIRSRSNGAIEFGNTMLALALAVTHVVAWGAGPHLELVPWWLSFTVANVASMALAWLALREDHEALFAIGLGGALIAPFTVGPEIRSYVGLAAYGLLLIGSSIRVLGERSWRLIAGITVVFVVVYTTSVTGFRADAEWSQRAFPVGFALALATLTLGFGRSMARQWVGLSALASMALALMASQAGRPVLEPINALLNAPELLPLALAGLVVSLALVRRFRPEEMNFWIPTVVLLPVLFLAPVATVVEMYGVVGGGIGALWACAYAMSALSEHGFRRAVLLGLADLASLASLVVALRDVPDAVPPAVAAHAVFFAWVARRERIPELLAISLAAILAVFLLSLSRIAEPAGFTAPFFSLASLGALAAIGAALVSMRLAGPLRIDLLETEGSNTRLTIGVAALLGFAWGWVELASAISRDVSTFLLVSYHAAWGVLAIGIGRRRLQTSLRVTGLVLATYAAAIAIVRAADIEQIGLRVGSYLAAGAFLLAVAWWYRQTTSQEKEDKGVR